MAANRKRKAENRIRPPSPENHHKTHMPQRKRARVGMRNMSSEGGRSAISMQVAEVNNMPYTPSFPNKIFGNSVCSTEPDDSAAAGLSKQDLPKPDKIASLNKCFIESACKMFTNDNKCNLKVLFEQYDKFYHEEIPKFSDIFRTETKKEVQEDTFFRLFGAGSSNKESQKPSDENTINTGDIKEVQEDTFFRLFGAGSDNKESENPLNGSKIAEDEAITIISVEHHTKTKPVADESRDANTCDVVAKDVVQDTLEQEDCNKLLVQGDTEIKTAQPLSLCTNTEEMQFANDAQTPCNNQNDAESIDSPKANVFADLFNKKETMSIFKKKDEYKFEHIFKKKK